MARPKRKVNPVLPVIVSADSLQRIYHTGGYVRLSVEDGGKPGADTLETQRELIQCYIDSQQDMELYDFYCDNGWTGTNFDRPEFERMMDDVRSGKVDCIVVKDLSRFGRNYRKAGDYLERLFPLLGVRFIAVNDNFDDGFDSIRPMDIDSLETSFKNLLYDLYSRDLSRKVRNAQKFRAQRGDFLSSFAPYGYIKDPADKNHLIIDQEAAETVRRIFQLAADGKEPKQIAMMPQLHPSNKIRKCIRFHDLCHPMPKPRKKSSTKFIVLERILKL